MATLRENEQVVIELPVPPGWTKKFTPRNGGTPGRNDFVFISPTGEEIRHKRQLEQYLKSHAGGPTLSEFDWGLGGDRVTPYDFFRIRLIYPLQAIFACLSLCFHFTFVVLLSISKRPFQYFDHRPFPLAVILIIIWPCHFLILRLVQFIEEHALRAISDRNGFLFSFTDALVSTGLAIGSPFLLEVLVTGQHFAGVLCLLIALTLLELWLLEDRDFCLGDCLFNIAEGIALLKIKDGRLSVIASVIAVVIFLGRRGSLFFARRMKLERKKTEENERRDKAKKDKAKENERARAQQKEALKTELELELNRAFETSRKEMEARLVKDFESAKTVMEANLKMKFESATEEMEAKFKMNLSAVKSGHEAEIIQMKEEHDTTVTRLHKEIPELALDLSRKE